MGYLSSLYILLLTMLRLNRVNSFSHSFKLLRNNRLITKRYLTTHIHSVGKKSGAEQFILDGISEYEKRLSSTMSIQNYYYKTDDDLINALDLVNNIIRITILLVNKNILKNIRRKVNLIRWSKNRHNPENSGVHDTFRFSSTNSSSHSKA